MGRRTDRPKMRKRCAKTRSCKVNVIVYGSYGNFRPCLDVRFTKRFFALYTSVRRNTLGISAAKAI